MWELQKNSAEKKIRLAQKDLTAASAAGALRDSKRRFISSSTVCLKAYRGERKIVRKNPLQQSWSLDSPSLPRIAARLLEDLGPSRGDSFTPCPWPVVSSSAATRSLPIGLCATADGSAMCAFGNFFWSTSAVNSAPHHPNIRSH